MNLMKTSDDKVMADLTNLVRQEQGLLLPILYYLREVERRRLFSREKQPSLFAYAVNVLKYSEDQAHRRIAAMRLLREIPEIEQDIGSGKLNLSHLGLVQTAFNREKKASREFSIEKKKEVLSKISGTSAREAKRVVAQYAPEVGKPDQIRTVSEESVELRFQVNAEILAQIDELRGRLAHSHPNISLGELMAILCNLGLDATAKLPAMSRVSQAEINRQVWRRDNYCCSICKSKYAVQVDHIIPRAMGGPSTLENMRLLCRSCNQRAAIAVFGQKKMDPYLISRPTNKADPFYPTQA